MVEYTTRRIDSTTTIREPVRQTSNKFVTQRIDDTTVIKTPVKDSDVWYENGKPKISATRRVSSGKNNKGENVTKNEPQGMMAIQEKDPATGKVIKTTYFVEDAINTTGGQKAIDQIVERQAAREELHQRQTAPLLQASGLSNLPWNQPQTPPTTTSGGGSSRNRSRGRSTIVQPTWHPPMQDPIRPTVKEQPQPTVVQNLISLKADPKAAAQQYFEQQGGRQTTAQETRSGTIQPVNYNQREFVKTLYGNFQAQNGQIPKSIQSQLQVQRQEAPGVRTKFNPYNPLSIVSIGTEYWQQQATKAIDAREERIAQGQVSRSQALTNYYLFQVRGGTATPDQIRQQDRAIQTAGDGSRATDFAIWGGAIAARSAAGVVHSFVNPKELVVGTVQFWGGAAKAAGTAVFNPVKTVKKLYTASEREQLGWVRAGIETGTAFYLYGKAFGAAGRAYERYSPYTVSIPKEGMPVPKFTRNIKGAYERSVAAQETARAMSDSMVLSERSGGRLTKSPRGEPVARIAGPKPAGFFSGIFGRARARVRERAGLPVKDRTLFESLARDDSPKPTQEAPIEGDYTSSWAQSEKMIAEMRQQKAATENKLFKEEWNNPQNTLKNIDTRSLASKGGFIETLKKFWKDERGNASGVFEIFEKPERVGEVARERRSSIFDYDEAREMRRGYRDSMRDSIGRRGRGSMRSPFARVRERSLIDTAVRPLLGTGTKAATGAVEILKPIADTGLKPVQSGTLTGLGVSTNIGQDTRSRSDTRLGLGTLIIPGLATTLILREVLAGQNSGITEIITTTGGGKGSGKDYWGFLLPKREGSLTAPRQKSQYVPSLTALGLNIKGKVRSGYGFGLTLRPIPV